MEASTNMTEPEPSDQELVPILAEPSTEASMSIFFQTGSTANPQMIYTTRPPVELAQELNEMLEFEPLELWYPRSVIDWCYNVVNRFADLHPDTDERSAVSAVKFLAAARFGEAQLHGASEEVMQTLLDELKSVRFRTQNDWQQLINPHRSVHIAFKPGFKGSIIKFAGPKRNYSVTMMKETELPIQAQLVMQHAFNRIDLLVSQEMRKIRYQAFAGPVHIEDLEGYDKICVICLSTYEIEKPHKDYGSWVPRYDCQLNNQEPVRLTCGHVFGTTCIEKWLYENNSCCMCRTTITGEGRKLQPVPREQRSTIATYEEGREFMFLEEIEWSQKFHDNITEVIQSGNLLTAVYSLEKQFKTLKEIDLRLGVSQTKTSTPVAGWMSKDWLRFEENAGATLHLLNGKYSSDEGCIQTDEELTRFRTLSKSITDMLSAGSERGLL